ncbi:MAG: malate dehydrogenase [Actinomycetota bacterium]|nr:malate dehydrogenase [Actinomycetota bacterium]
MSVVGEEHVREAFRRGERKLAVSNEDIATPQALDAAERLGVQIVRGPLEKPAPMGADPGRAIRRSLYRRGARWVAPDTPRGLTPTRFARLGFIGVGGLGATTAHLAAISGMADEICLMDIVPGRAASIALDIEHASGITGSPTRARGGTTLDLVSACDAIVITAGRPRTPGMDRTALCELNGPVVRGAAEAIAQYAPDAVTIVVTDPLDEMTYELWRTTGQPAERVIGMAATLDSSRWRNAIAAAAGVPPRDVQAITLGSHGEELVPVVSAATVRGRSLIDVLPQDRIESCVRETVGGGAAVVGLRRTGSATIAPAHATIELLEAIRGAQAGWVPVSAYVQGEYGVEDLFIGVPAVLGRSGVLEIVELKLSEPERSALAAAAAAIRGRLDGARARGRSPEA